MATVQLYPPSKRLVTTTWANGRPYTAQAGQAIPVIDFDAPILTANGWDTQPHPAQVSVTPSRSGPISFNGRTYVGVNGQPILVPDFDAAVLEANGWTEVSGMPVVSAQAGLIMTHLASGRIYQRTTKTGGAAGKGAGSITVPITLTATATRVEYRLRDALASGNPTIQDWTTAATNVPASATSVACPGVPADAKQYLLDLRANGDNGQIALGTSPVMMGRLIAASGQSQMVRQFALIPGYVGTNASLGVTISPYCAVYAGYSDTSATNGGYQSPAWAPPADGGNYGSTFASEFLRRQVASSGVACGWVGYSVGGTAIATWAPGQPNNVALRAVLDAVGGFEAFYWHQGGDDASAGTSIATYKAALDAMFADINGHNAAWDSTYTRMLTAMATRTSSGAGTTATVQAIRQASKQWAATNGGIYLEPHDITLADGAVHQDQAGNITLAQHAHRALASSDMGATLGTPTRVSGSTSLNLPVTLPSGATNLVFTGNAYTRFGVFPAGTQVNPIAVTAAAWDATNSRIVLTLASAPADSQALDVYAFLHPDPSGTTAYADMIRDDRVDGDGIAVGRSLEPTTAGPVTCAALASSGPAIGDVFLVNFYDTRTANNPAVESGWNNYDQATSGPLALINSSGAASALTAKVTNGSMTGGNTGGKTTGNNSGVFPDDVLLTSVFADKTNGAGVGVSTLIDVAFSGFASGTQWKVEAVGSRAVASRKEDIAVNGGTAIVADVGNNTAISATFTNVAPVNGKIDLTVTQDGSETYCYLNGVRLTRTA